ncbi:MAG: sensor histidine kinase, partial [Oceanococcaceae bacterium]
LVRDNTSRVEAERARAREAEEQARAEAMSQFAYIASHDLQEPVRNMSTVADMLRADKNNMLSPQSEKALGFLTTATNRMRNLIHGLLEYSRIGRASEAELVDLNEVLDNVQADLRLRIEETRAEIRIENHLPTFTMYEVEVRMLFQNLISNALKFIPADRQPHIRIASQTLSPGHWRFSISDNGIGIPVSQYKKVFTIFHRATTRKEFEGTGIGLAHCLKIAELHHGKIWVRESSPEGTTFSVELMEVHDDDA